MLIWCWCLFVLSIAITLSADEGDDDNGVYQIPFKRISRRIRLNDGKQHWDWNHFSNRTTGVQGLSDYFDNVYVAEIRVGTPAQVVFVMKYTFALCKFRDFLLSWIRAVRIFGYQIYHVRRMVVVSQKL